MNHKTLHGLAAVLVALLAPACASTSSRGTTFATAEEAVESIIAALRAHDLEKAKEILGSGADDVLHSGDDASDRESFAQFVAAYDAGHKLVPAADGGMHLMVGETDWPVPIPVVEENGRWSFDTEAGLDEVLSRRIGRNELDAVQVCLAIVDAQREFAASDPDGDGVQEYARKFKSDDGKRNGLYWPAQPGEPQSPLGAFVAEAAEHGYARGSATADRSRPYRGYHYRILESQGPSANGGERDYLVNGRMIGGFAVVAWPAEYAKSGIMIFLVSHDGVVFEKDFGDQTADKSRTLTTFSPGAGWNKVQ